MGRENQYYVYIMSNKSKTLYVGMTNNIQKRVYEHKNKLFDGFTKKYNIHQLLYFETFGDSNSAIAREKTIKGWLRKKKIELISRTNPHWKDLSQDWYDGDSSLRSEGQGERLIQCGGQILHFDQDDKGGEYQDDEDGNSSPSATLRASQINDEGLLIKDDWQFVEETKFHVKRVVAIRPAVQKDLENTVFWADFRTLGGKRA